MRSCCVFLALLAAGVSGFTVAPNARSAVAPLASSVASSTTPEGSEKKDAAPAKKQMSKSVPFVTKTPKLDGLIGSAEFDPLYVSSWGLPIKYLQESEIKHGRVAMLAVVGFVLSEVFRFPGAQFQATNPVDAPSMVGIQPLVQIFLLSGVAELFFHKGKLTADDMHDNGETPGDFGLDPLGLAKGANADKQRLSEIKNGRLAMLAIGGLIVQSALTGHGVPLN